VPAQGWLWVPDHLYVSKWDRFKTKAGCLQMARCISGMSLACRLSNEAEAFAYCQPTAIRVMSRFAVPAI
jgi:hypothetical protein